MNTRLQTDTWISRIFVVLGLILVLSEAGILILMITEHILPEIFVALGFVVAGGLIRLLISPLSQQTFSFHTRKPNKFSFIAIEARIRKEPA